MLPLKHTNLAVYAALGTGLAVAATAVWYRKHRQAACAPKSWRQVGELSQLWCYPVKSCAAVTMQGTECVILGLQQDMLRDRVFMVTGLDNSFKTARTFPHMTQIKPSIEDDTLTLRAPGMEDVSLDIAALLHDNKQQVKATVWEQQVPAVDCGDEVASWLSRFILKKDTGCRLVFYPRSESKRDVRPKNAFSKLTSRDTGAFPDASSYMIINEASVRDLRGKLEEGTSCTPLHFRPNFVVAGQQLQPYEEDEWRWVKIGDNAIFQCVKPCTRCIFTNINPVNGIPSPNHEPLKTLKTYRQITDPVLRPFTGDSPVLGVHLALHSEGRVNLGDPVYVSND